MNKHIKRFLSLVLALVMVSCVLPMGAMADETSEIAEDKTTVTVYFDNSDAQWRDVYALYACGDSFNPITALLNQQYVHMTQGENNLWSAEIPKGNDTIGFVSALSTSAQSSDAYTLVEGQTYKYTPPAIDTLDKLKAAINAAAATDDPMDDVITVTKLLTYNSLFSSTTLDLKGCTLYLPGIMNFGTMTIKNGTLIGTSRDYNTVDSFNNITLTNVNVAGTRHAVRIENGKATINGGTYTLLSSGMTHYALDIGHDSSMKATVVINSGTFIGPKSSGDGAAMLIYSGSTVTVNNGTFSNSSLAGYVAGTLKLTGGTFDSDPTKWVNSGYRAAKNNDGTWTVVPADVVARIGDVLYKSVDSAVTASAAGQTILLLADATWTGDLNGAALDLNGYSMTGDVLGTIRVNGGTYTNARNEIIAGPAAGCFLTSDAVLTFAANSVTQESGTVTLAQSRSVAEGQTLIISQGAAFTVPAEITLSVSGAVISDGTLISDGTVNLAAAAATVKASDNLNVTTTVTDSLAVYFDGVWKVAPAVAQVGTINFATFADAVAAAQDGETVTLLTDVTTGVITVVRSVTLNLNGNSITGTGSSILQICGGVTLNITGGTLSSDGDRWILDCMEGKDIQVTVSSDTILNGNIITGFTSENDQSIILPGNCADRIRADGYGARTLANDQIQVTAKIEYTFLQSTQLGLIEPWFLKSNLYVKNGETFLTESELNALKDFGVCFVRASELGNPDELPSVEDILNSPHTIRYSKNDDTHKAVIELGSAGYMITASYKEGIYTYELNDPVYVLFYIEDEFGVRYDVVKTRNLLDIATRGAANTKLSDSERAVYTRMIALYEAITTHRAGFENIPAMPEFHAPTITAGMFGEYKTGYTFQHSTNIVLIEPWGIKLNAYLDGDVQIEESGVVVFCDRDGIYESAPSVEELLGNADAYVLSTGAGNASASASGKYTKIEAYYTKDIFTYQLDDNLYAVFFVKINGEYHFGAVKTRNVLSIIEGHVNKADYPATERAVYQAMIDMYYDVIAHRAKFGK